MKKSICKHLVLTVFLMPALLYSGSYQIKMIDGVPRLTENGKQVFPGMLYVNPTLSHRLEYLSTETKDFSLQFHSPVESAAGELFLRFNGLKAEEDFDVAFSEIVIYDKTEGRVVDGMAECCNFRKPLNARWKFNPIYKDGLVFESGRGVLRIKTRPRDLSEFIDFYLTGIPLKKDHLYTVSIRGKANRKLTFSPFVRVYTKDGIVLMLDSSTVEEQVRHAAAAGIHFVTFLVPAAWKKPDGTVDYFLLDRFCRMILKANPKAKLIPRIALSASGAVSPKWLPEKFKDEMMVYSNGIRGNAASICSVRYWNEAAAAARRVVRYCESNFPENMAGYHPAGGLTQEWIYDDIISQKTAGYDPHTLKAWRRWLKKKYVNDKALQKAWKDKDVILSAVQIPTEEMRRGTPETGLRNPENERRITDFSWFLQESMADLACCMAKAVKEESGRQRLNLCFYGYLYELSGFPDLGPGSSGHLALKQVLKSPDIDILVAPFSYHGREVQGPTGVQAPADSIMLAGKLWLNEDDTRTYIQYDWQKRKGDLHVKDKRETRHILKRNMMLNLTRNFGTWWMDLYGRGWYNDPDLWQDMSTYKKLAEELHLPQYAPEIASVVDGLSMSFCYSASAWRSTTLRLISYTRFEYSRIGAATGLYIIDDIIAGRIKPRLNLFLAAYALDGKQRDKLREIGRKTASVWCWAPGYIDLDAGRFSLQAVRELTGFQVKEVSGETTLQVYATKEGIAWGLPAKWGQDKRIFPTLSPRPEPGDVVLANYSNGSPAVVFRPAQAPSLFIGTTDIPKTLYRIMAGKAGVHLYVKEDSFIYVNPPFLAFAIPWRGEVSLNLKKKNSAENVFTKIMYPQASRLRFKMTPDQMTVLKLK